MIVEQLETLFSKLSIENDEFHYHLFKKMKIHMLIKGFQNSLQRSASVIFIFPIKIDEDLIDGKSHRGRFFVTRLKTYGFLINATVASVVYIPRLKIDDFCMGYFSILLSFIFSCMLFL